MAYSAKAKKKPAPPAEPKQTPEQIATLVRAAEAARSTFDTLRREGTSFSREAYVKGYQALTQALVPFNLF